MTDKAMSSTSGNQALSSECNGLTIDRYGRFWAVYDNRSGCGCSEQQSARKQTAGQLVCVTVYKKGAQEVVRRLEAAAPTTDETTTDEGLTTDGACRGTTPAGNGHDE